MKLPPKVQEKYLDRLDELIQKGEQLPVHKKPVKSGGNYATGKVSYREVEEIDLPKFIEWRTNCITVLEQVVPQKSVHRSTLDSFQTLSNIPSQLNFGISFLRSLREDIDRGFLQNLASEIESEITADYMGQAENLLKEGSPGKYDHVPAAVLAGAVLEKSLKTICSQLSPPEHTNTQNGSPLKLNALH